MSAACDINETSRIAFRVGQLSAALTVVAVIWFSYLPFLYLTNFVGLDKRMLFALVIAVLVGVQIIRAIVNDGRFDRHILTTLMLYALFPVYTLLVYLVHGMPSAGGAEVFAVCIVNSFFALQAVSLCAHKREVIHTFVALLTGYAVFMFYAVWIGQFSISSVVAQNFFPGLEIRTIYQNASMYIGLLAVLLPVVSADRGWQIKAAVNVGVVFLLAAILLIGGRTALLAVSVVIALRFWRWARYGRYQALQILAAFIIALPLVVAVDWRSVVPEHEAVFGLSRLAALLEGGDASSRMFLFSKAVELSFTDVATFLIGAGPNQFPEYIRMGQDMYPHNLVLELLSEYGLIGLVTFFVPIAYVLRIRATSLESLAGGSSVEHTTLLAVVFIWIVFSFTGSLSSSWLLVFFTYLLLTAGNADESQTAA